MNIEDKIYIYKKELDYFEDNIDKYKYLLEQGKKATNFPEKYRKKIFLVQGCQAQVWLVPEFKNGILNFLALRKSNNSCDTHCYCRYPDTDVRDIIIDYELEKAKKLDKALKDTEQK